MILQRNRVLNYNEIEKPYPILIYSQIGPFTIYSYIYELVGTNGMIFEARFEIGID